MNSVTFTVCLFVGNFYHIKANIYIYICIYNEHENSAWVRTSEISSEVTKTRCQGVLLEQVRLGNANLGR